MTNDNGVHSCSLSLVSVHLSSIANFCIFPLISGVPKPGFFKPGCLQILRGSDLLRPFALFCALLRTCVCTLCAHLRVSTNDRV